MTQISVIIPCFNAEKYINECITSIINYRNEYFYNKDAHEGYKSNLKK